MRVVGHLSMILLYVLTSVQVSAADVALSELELKSGVPWTEKFRSNIAPTLEKYNGFRTHKAMAVALTADRNVALGWSWKAVTPLVAVQQALASCEQSRAQRQLEAVCEIVLSNDNIVPLGVSHFANLPADTPSNVWLIESGGSTVYLMGTIHVLKPSVFPLPAAYETAYAAADKLAMEVNPLLGSDWTRVSALQQLVAADAKEIRKAMPKKLRKQLSAYLKTQGVKLNKLIYGQKPMMTALELGQLSATALGYSGNSGVEMHYARRASADGIAIIELEDPVKVFASLVELSMDVQFRSLALTIDELESNDSVFAEILDAWLGGDAEVLYKLATVDYKNDPLLAELEKVFLDDRNHDMAGRILGFLDESGITTAMVGAAHLGGEKGILNLLRKQGYQPVQLDITGDPID